MVHRFTPVALVLGAGVFASLTATAHDSRHRPPPRPAQPLLCAQLAGDAGGLVGTIGMLAVFVMSAARNTRALYLAEPLPGDRR